MLVCVTALLCLQSNCMKPQKACTVLCAGMWNKTNQHATQCGNFMHWQCCCAPHVCMQLLGKPCKATLACCVLRSLCQFHAGENTRAMKPCVVWRCLVAWRLAFFCVFSVAPNTCNPYQTTQCISYAMIIYERMHIASGLFGCFLLFFCFLQWIDVYCIIWASNGAGFSVWKKVGSAMALVCGVWNKKTRTVADWTHVAFFSIFFMCNGVLHVLFNLDVVGHALTKVCIALRCTAFFSSFKRKPQRLFF